MNVFTLLRKPIRYCKTERRDKLIKELWERPGIEPSSKEKKKTEEEKNRVFYIRKGLGNLPQETFND